MMELAKTCFMLAIVCHWFACIWGLQASFDPLGSWPGEMGFCEPWGGAACPADRVCSLYACAASGTCAGGVNGTVCFGPFAMYMDAMCAPRRAASAHTCAQPCERAASRPYMSQLAAATRCPFVRLLCQAARASHAHTHAHIRLHALCALPDPSTASKTNACHLTTPASSSSHVALPGSRVNDSRSRHTALPGSRVDSRSRHTALPGSRVDSRSRHTALPGSRVDSRPAATRLRAR
jgi:hypothetical protein